MAQNTGRTEPSSEIQTSGSNFSYHHSVIFPIRIMPVRRVNFKNMPKICQTTFCTKEDKCVDTSNKNNHSSRSFDMFIDLYTSTH